MSRSFISCWIGVGGFLLVWGLAGRAMGQGPDESAQEPSTGESAEPPAEKAPTTPSRPPAATSAPPATTGPGSISESPPPSSPAASAPEPPAEIPKPPDVPVAPPAVPTAAAVPSALPVPEPPPDQEVEQPSSQGPPEAPSEEPEKPKEKEPEDEKAEAAPPPNPVPVRVGGRNVYMIRVPQGTKSLEERAQAAQQAIRKAVDSETPESVRIEDLGDAKVIYAGSLPLLHLTVEDAVAAGDASLGVHADRVAAELREVIGTEQKRSAIATTIFGVSLAALLTLAALLLLRKTSEFTARVRDWVSSHRENIPGIKLQSLEVVDAATIRSAVALGVEVSKWLLRIGIVYLWLLLTLSLFESTREYTQDLTGVVLTPLSSLMARIAKSLPVLVVALIAMAAIAVLVRFVDLFFAGVARGETKLVWLSPDLAPATSVLLRVGLVICALVFAAPVVTGDAEGALSKIGAILLVVLGLSSTPLVASSLAGARILYGRKLQVGDFVEFGGRSGRVLGVNLLEARLEDAHGSEVRVPHLLSFLHGTRIWGTRPRTSVELLVSNFRREVCEVLRRAASQVGDRPIVEVMGVDGKGAVRYCVSVATARSDARNALFFCLTEALDDAGVPLSHERQLPAAEMASGA